MENRARCRIIVSGVVQGVGYRYFAVRVARELGLTGWVRNREDGAVEVEAEGEAGALHAFVKELRVGPRSARVAGVEVEELPPGKQLEDFNVRF